TNNTFSGGLFITQGTLAFDDDTVSTNHLELGANNTNITINGGTLNFTGPGNASGATSGNPNTLPQKLIIGPDGGTFQYTFSGSAITITATSVIRLGQFFGNTNINLNISGSLTGTGSLTFIDAQNWGGTSANPFVVAQPPSGNFLNLTGSNTGYRGTFILS